MSTKDLRRRYHEYYYKGQKKTAETSVDTLIGKRFALQYFNETGKVPTIENLRKSMGYFSNNDVIELSFNDTVGNMFKRYKQGLPILSGTDYSFLKEEKEWSSIPKRYVTKIDKSIVLANRDPKAPRLQPGLLEDTAATLAPFGASIFAGGVGTITGNPLLGLTAGVLSKPFLDKGLEAHGHKSKYEPGDLDSNIDKTAEKIYEKSTLTMNEARKVAETTALTGLATGIAQNAWDKTIRSNNSNPAGTPAGFSAVPIGTAHTAYLPKGGQSRTFFYNGRQYSYYNNKFGSYRTRRFRYRHSKIYKKYNKRYRRYRRHYF